MNIFEKLFGKIDKDMDKLGKYIKSRDIKDLGKPKTTKSLREIEKELWKDNR